MADKLIKTEKLDLLKKEPVENDIKQQLKIMFELKHIVLNMLKYLSQASILPTRTTFLQI